MELNSSFSIGDRVTNTLLGAGTITAFDGTWYSVHWDSEHTGCEWGWLNDISPLSEASPVEVISPREELLLGAVKAVIGDRNNQYGPPTQDFERTAAFWSAAFKDKLKDGVTFDSHEVAVALSLLKISRISWNPGKQDSWMDLAGYAACGWECVTDEAD